MDYSSTDGNELCLYCMSQSKDRLGSHRDKFYSIWYFNSYDRLQDITTYSSALLEKDTSICSI